jgi:hypothetical protein
VTREPLRHGLAALALLAALGAGLPQAAGEPRAIDATWTLFPSRMQATRVSVACGEELAAARNWHGDVRTFDGTDWSSLPSLPGEREGKTYGDAIAVSPSGKEICVEASGRVACWSGEDWKVLELPGWNGPIGGLALLGTGELLVTGRGRLGLRVGDAIVSHDAGTWRELGAVAGGSLDDLWTVGQGGTVMRRAGSAWTRMATGASGWLTGLQVESSSEAWAWGGPLVHGAAPLVLRWHGGAWRPAQDGLREAIHGLAGPADRPWASSDSSVARFDGTRWVEELAASSLAGDYQRLGGLCTTRRLVVVVNEGPESGAVVRKR